MFHGWPTASRGFFLGRSLFHVLILRCILVGWRWNICSWKPLCKFNFDACELWIIGQILPFHRIVHFVVQFFAAIMVLNVTPFLGANPMVFESVSCQCSMVPRRRRILQKRNDAFSFSRSFYWTVGRNLSVMLDVVIEFNSTLSNVQMEIGITSCVVIEFLEPKATPDWVVRNSALYFPFASVIPIDGRILRTIHGNRLCLGTPWIAGSVWAVRQIAVLEFSE